VWRKSHWHFGGEGASVGGIAKSGDIRLRSRRRRRLHQGRRRLRRLRRHVDTGVVNDVAIAASDAVAAAAGAGAPGTRRLSGAK